MITTAARQKGFTLAEFGFVIVIAIGILATLAAVSAGSTAATDRQTTIQQVLRLDQAIRSHYANQANFASITTANVIAQGVAPPDLIQVDAGGPTQLRSAFGGQIYVAASTYVGGGVDEASGASYQISIHGMTPQDCREMNDALAPSALRILVANPLTSGTTVSDRGQALNRDAVASLCSSNAWNDIYYVSN